MTIQSRGGIQSRVSRRSTNSKPSIANKGGIFASDMTVNILDPILGRKNRYDLASSRISDDDVYSQINPVTEANLEESPKRKL